MQTAQEFLAGDQFSNFVEVELMEIKPGSAKAKLEIKEHHLNGAGVVQGGAIFTLADLAVAAAANSHGNLSLVIQSNVSYIKAISKGTLYAEAAEESLGAKLGTYRVRVSNETGELIATVQATVYRKKEAL